VASMTYSSPCHLVVRSLPLSSFTTPVWTKTEEMAHDAASLFGWNEEEEEEEAGLEEGEEEEEADEEGGG